MAGPVKMERFPWLTMDKATMYGSSWEIHEWNQHPAWPGYSSKALNVLESAHRSTASE